VRRVGGLVWAALALAPLAGAVEVDLPRYPSLSPDGSQLVFSWRGDLWKVGSRGGRAERLTRDAASDLRSAWSPDGSQIAFDSERSGALNLWVMQADGSGLRQVTHSDAWVVLTGWDPAGTHLLATGRFEGDVYRSNRPYRVAVAGGPLTRLIDAYGTSPQLSPDGTLLAFVRGASSWTRRHYRGPDAREVWLYELTTQRFRRLTAWPGNDGRPRWLGARTLAFLSDRDGTANVWVQDVTQGEARQATRFADADVTTFDVARDGSWAVAVSWDGLYGWDPRDPGATPVRLQVSAAEDGPPRMKRVDVGGEVSEVALHPSGGAVALVAYGRVFVRGLGDHDDPVLVSPGPDRAGGVRWSPDGVWLYFTSDRDGSDSIYRARVTRARRDVLEAYREHVPEATPFELEGEEPPEEGAEEPAEPTGEEFAERWRTALSLEVEGLIVGPTQDREPSPGPRGRWLAFRRGRGDLVLRDLNLAAGEPGAERVLVANWDRSLNWAWSPDGRHLAYSTQDRAFNSDVFVVPVDGSAPAVNVSMHPNDDYAPSWSPDGKTLAFLSSRDADEADVWRVHLDRRLDGMTAAETEAYHDGLGKLELAPPSVAEVQSAMVAAPDTQARALDLDDAYLRLERITEWRGDESDLALLPSGMLVSEGGVEARTLYHVDHAGKRTALGTDARLAALSWDRTTALAITRGRVSQGKAAGGSLERIPFAAELDVDRVAESSQKFREAARVLGEVFYHPTLKGLDWAALSERYHALAVRARTANEFSEVANRFIGELNASHLGIRPPSERPETFEPNGRLGVDVREEPSGALVTRVLDQGPAATAPTPLKVGDRIVAVRGAAWLATDSLEARLRGRVGKETLLEVLRPREGEEPLRLEVLVTPIGSGAERTLRYHAWTAARRAKVHELSGGRLGYLHIRGMNMPSLIEFERDLFAAGYGREGLLMDVRNNGGGWTADRVLGALMARPHAYTVPRGADPGYTQGYPQGRLYIQRYTKPVNMLCNEKSFSNAEILSHAFRTHGRGNLVGEQTYGGVISTGGMSLLDGTTVRLPFRGWYLLDGTDMENNGAVPHLRVPQTPEDEVAGIDRQLQVAVEDLLERLDAPR